MNRTLVLTDHAQIGRVEQTDPSLLDSSRVVAVSPLAAIALASSGRPVTLAAELLDPQAVAAVDDRAFELSQSWFNHLGEALVFEGVNLADLLALDHLMFLKQALGADLICSELLAGRPGEVVLFAPRGRACADGAAFKDEHDVFEATLLWRAGLAGVPVRLLPSPAPAAAPAAPARKAPARRHPLRIGAEEFRPDGRPLALAFAGGVDVLRHQPYLDSLDASGRWQTLALSVETYLEGMTTRSGLGGLERPYLSMQDFAPEPDPAAQAAWNSRLDEARRADRAHRSRGAGQVLDNPGLDFQWDLLWDGHFRTALAWLRRFGRLFDSIRPDLALADEGAYFLYRLFLWAAQARGIATASVPHGNMINYPHYLHFAAQRLFCSGQAMREAAVAKAGRHPGRIELVGDPTMVQALRHTPVAHPRKTVFFADQRYVNYTLCQMDLHAYLRAWVDLADYARSRPDVDVLIKPHPSYGYRDWQVAEATRHGLPNLRIVEDRKVEELLAESDVALMLGRISNAGLTTIQMGVPLLFYDGISRVPSYGDYLWTPDNGILTVHDRAGLYAALDRLLGEPGFARGTAAAQRRVIARHYPDIITDPAGRFLAAADRLLAANSESLSNQGRAVA